MKKWMSKIEESNYNNTHEAKDAQTMIKDGLDVRDKPFSRQCIFTQGRDPK